MLNRSSYTKKIKKVNPSNVFQYGHLYKPVAASSKDDLKSPFKLFKQGVHLFHDGIIQEVIPAATGNGVRMASSGFSKKRGGTEKSSQGFPLEALSPITNRRAFFSNKFNKPQGITSSAAGTQH